MLEITCSWLHGCCFEMGFDVSTVQQYINLLFHSLDAEHSPPTANATKTERLQVSLLRVVCAAVSWRRSWALQRQTLLKLILGSRDRQRTIGQQKGHRVHSSTFGACLMFALSWRETLPPEGVTLPPVPYTLECPKAGTALAGNRQAIVTLHLPFGRLVLG